MPTVTEDTENGVRSSQAVWEARPLCARPVIGKFSFSTLRPRFPDCQHTLSHFSRWSPCTHAYCHRGHREWSAQLAGSLGSAPFVCQACNREIFIFHTEAALPRLPAHTEPFFALEPLHTCLLSPRTQRMECAARRQSGKRALCVPGL